MRLSRTEKDPRQDRRTSHQAPQPHLPPVLSSHGHLFQDRRHRSPVEIHRASATEMYSYCRQHDLKDAWALELVISTGLVASVAALDLQRDLRLRYDQKCGVVFREDEERRFGREARPVDPSDGGAGPQDCAGGKGVVGNIREEPILQANGRPHVLRRFGRPL
jgi:hypothetical protein